MTTLGKRLKKLRRERRYTLQQLSDLTSLSTSYLSRLENESRVPSEVSLRLLADTLEIDFYELHLLLKKDYVYIDLLDVLKSPSVCVLFNKEKISDELKNKTLKFIKEQA